MPLARRAAPLALLFLTQAPLSLAAQSSLTIYNDGRVLVRRGFDQPVPRGLSTQTVRLGAADPATLFPLDDDVAIERSTYDGAVDEQSVLRRAVGRRLTFRMGPRPGPNGTTVQDTLSALVLGVDPLRLQLADGRVAFNMPGQPLYPAELVVAEPTATLGVRSGSARDQLRLGYFSSGAGWQAAYSVVLGGSDARVSGRAVVSSESLRADSADVQLLAGEVSRANPQAPMFMDKARAVGRVAAQAREEARMVEQRVGEFHLYTLPGRHTLLPGQTTTAALFEPVTVKYERNLVVPGQIPFWGYLPEQQEENDVPVEVSYTLKRPRKTEFGDRPLPGGVARMYEADSSGRLQLIGEASTGHTAAGNDLRLSAGNAFDLTARRVQTSYVTRRDSLPQGVWRTTATAGYSVTIKNATDADATIDVLEERGGEWSVLSSSVPAEKLSSTRTRFRVRVPARGETALAYKVRVIW
jgi:hypothetical protein